MSESISSERQWLVYCVSLSDHRLLVENWTTGSVGYVPDPSPEEWHKAISNLGCVYPWHDDSRIVIVSKEDPSLEKGQ